MSCFVYHQMIWHVFNKIPFEALYKFIYRDLEHKGVVSKVNHAKIELFSFVCTVYSVQNTTVI